MAKTWHYHTETILNGQTYSISPRCEAAPLTKADVRSIRKTDFDRRKGWTYRSMLCTDKHEGEQS